MNTLLAVTLPVVLIQKSPPSMMSLTVSIACAESIIAPSTYSSASRFWGGRGVNPADGAGADVAIRG